VPDATLSLQAAPASGGAPGFSFGCGTADGSSSCDLGTVDAKSAPRQLQAQLTVPVTASSVKSVRLTVIGSAANLTKTPEASATVAITAPPASTTAPQNPTSQNTGTQNTGTQNAGIQNTGTQNPGAQNAGPQDPASTPPVPAAVTSPLSVGSLPSIPAVSPSLSQGGNAATLFPTLDPTPAGGLAQSTGKAHTRPVADTSALPEGASVVDAQLAGLCALALAFVLAVTRLSIRRRPTPAKPATDSKPTTGDPPAKAPDA